MYLLRTAIIIYILPEPALQWEEFSTQPAKPGQHRGPATLPPLPVPKPASPPTGARAPCWSGEGVRTTALEERDENLHHLNVIRHTLVLLSANLPHYSWLPSESETWYQL